MKTTLFQSSPTIKTSYLIFEHAVKTVMILVGTFGLWIFIAPNLFGKVFFEIIEKLGEQMPWLLPAIWLSLAVVMNIIIFIRNRRKIFIVKLESDQKSFQVEIQNKVSTQTEKITIDFNDVDFKHQKLKRMFLGDTTRLQVMNQGGQKVVGYIEAESYMSNLKMKHYYDLLRSIERIAEIRIKGWK